MDSREPPAAHTPPPAVMMAGPPNSYASNLPNIPSPMISHNSTVNRILQNNLFPFSSMTEHMDSLTSQLASPSPFGDGSQLSVGGLKPSGFSIEQAKRKRGRPRKYSPDGNIAPGLAAAPVTPTSSLSHVDCNIATPSSDTPAKRSRGRPPGSGKKQLNAIGSTGVGFTPHIISVKAGEDVASKIMAFSQEGSRTVCILSANGTICSVTLRQPAMSGGTATYEGQFEIISLSGSFLLSEDNGNRSRTGGLSVSLVGSDGRVLGGGVSGTLIAATPVEVIVGSFIADVQNSNSGPSSEPQTNMSSFGGPASPLSHGGPSRSPDENGNSPLNQGGSVLYSNASQPSHSLPIYSTMSWSAQR